MNMIPPSPAPSGGSGLKIPILFGLVVALLGANVYLYTQLDGMKTEMADFRKNVQNELASVKESSSVSVQTARRNISQLKEELDAARRSAQASAGQARSEAEKHAEQLARQLKAEQSKLEAAQGQLKTEITQVSETASTKIGEVKTDVGAVKAEVAATKTELDNTINDLKRVRGDLGETSGLVATNSKELAALKALGERNYFEFNLMRAKEATKVGDITMRLTKADPKKNKFTVEIVADDKKVEKKDRNVNEPLQFYVAKARQPYEVVVNQVRKDQIMGYLATPKVQAARN